MVFYWFFYPMNSPQNNTGISWSIFEQYMHRHVSITLCYPLFLRMAPWAYLTVWSSQIVYSDNIIYHRLVMAFNWYYTCTLPVNSPPPVIIYYCSKYRNIITKYDSLVLWEIRTVASSDWESKMFNRIWYVLLISRCWTRQVEFLRWPWYIRLCPQSEAYYETILNQLYGSQIK